ncbi:MAG: acyl-CoA dehydrogenase family protein [Gordonia sp. (in: high G+C Gram-positive bacteria)]
MGTVDSVLETARTVAAQLRETVSERDRKGGSAIGEVDLLRRNGLLTLVIPTQYGGPGHSWRTALQVVAEISAADGSVGNLLNYHLDNLALFDNFADDDQRQQFFPRVITEGLYVGNASSEQNAHVDDRRTLLRAVEGGYVLNGAKDFASGSGTADVILVAASNEDGKAVQVLLPADREGVEILRDWDALGLRQTDSGGIRLRDVRVSEGDILGEPGSLEAGLAGYNQHALFGPLAQLSFSFTYLGIARGALQAAAEYTRTKTRPYVPGGVTEAVGDPHILRLYGEIAADHDVLWSALLDVAHDFDAAWQRRDDLNAELCDRLAIRVSGVKVVSTRVALETTQRIYQAMGARSTKREYDFDRYWRDIRTHTLHDPVDHRAASIGRYLLTGESPAPRRRS